MLGLAGPLVRAAASMPAAERVVLVCGCVSV